ncbi:ribosome biogenesis GTP-binding protein YihA/YsxC [Helicobacter sp.]|uniref:ribosome biogenesis GTP-binding protein YihA/YsxC n=1 Tax=Helicobacter sp. TaxID=218 RepID=UPI002A7C7F3F|nr:ribosome biogenesis GTP-binding protein YihA/YsxC [Helicobacter sp.]MCI7711061.1 ribosome biogenesis GTP-binding protein YihA/YsxC [Helicobacter sp.]MDD7345823.1 ribosome biogenesis GTP-binding protein YihA/YsxC [Helicobacter sp.]MDY2823370.1 ribosome biogenesis GTP-binding protein YihA/YsxC [Helicobacter sp.]
MLIAKNARFFTSAQHIAQAPSPQSSEIVFLGRSNVGKSSLLNILLGKKLAKSSATPGKTQLINFFGVEFVNDDEILPLVFVDLPGFGYAKVSKEIKAKWEKNLLEFLQKRSAIKLFIHLRDARHPNLAQDDEVLQFLTNLKRGDQEIVTIFTKADKLTQSEIAKLKNSRAILSSTLQNPKLKIPTIEELRTIILQKVLGYNQ